MQWKDVVGNTEVVHTLKQMVDNQQLPNALLLFGADGYAELSMARALIQYTYCSNRRDGESCNTCANCHKVSKFIHPDIHYTFPVQRKEKKQRAKDFYPEWRQFLEQQPFGDLKDWGRMAQIENKQLNISKDDCMQVLRDLSLKAYEGGKKLSLIWMAEYLGKESNRLLKVIEEPPENTHFILIASEEDKILPTILSRCQIVKLHRIQDDEMLEFLGRNGDQSDNQEITYVADGNLALAIRMQSAQGLEYSKAWIEWMRILYKGLAHEMVKWVDQFGKMGKETQKSFLHFGLHFARELQIGMLSTTYKPKIKSADMRSFDGLKKVLDIDKVQHLILIINQQLYHIERNANVKISMMDASIALKNVMKAAAVQIQT